MTRSYYNEFEPYAAKWLRSLIDAGLLPKGDIDERSIEDVSPSDLEGYTQCHFFAGLGGWALAARLAGWPDDRPLWTGSCPCQPFSVAGKGQGLSDERHLWPVFRNLVARCRPDVLMGEQVAGTSGRSWFDAVSFDLEDDGYATRAVDIPACSVGALHVRSRLYWIASDTQWNKQSRQEPRRRAVGRVGRIKQPVAWHPDWQGALSEFRALDDGLPRRVGATDAARNAIVPALAAEVIAAFLEAEQPSMFLEEEQA